MATEHQIAANRRNALKSTGPRSSAGKQRASRNARRHGFASAAFRTGDPKKIEAVARQIGREASDPFVLEPARVTAQATLDLALIRLARVDMIAVAIAAASPADMGAGNAKSSDASGRAIKDAIGHLLKLERYEKRAVGSRSRQVRKMRALAALCKTNPKFDRKSSK
jgi:hypothetical protein